MKEELIKKWLNDELKPEELEAFKQLDEYNSYIKLSEKAKYFKSPEFDQQQNFDELQSIKRFKQKKSKSGNLRYISAIAAILLVAFTLYKTLGINNDLTSYKTLVAKTELIDLPDQSSVTLNANSQLELNSENWVDKRELSLEGEAYFEVQKGSKFTVNTNFGQVEVLGTKFNVRARDYAFEVTCYEGSVGVEVNNQSFILKMNDKLVLNKDEVIIENISNLRPDWEKGFTVFKSQTLEKVLKEFQNYYNVEFSTGNIDTSMHLSGSFTHNNMEIALNSITLPLGLTYKIDDKKIFLSKK